MIRTKLNTLARGLAALVLIAVMGCAGGWRNEPAAVTSTGVPQAAATPAASAEGTKFVYKGDGGSVAVAGEFNSWNTTADMLTKQSDGTWSLVKQLQPGKYAYKFVVDGTNWKADELAKETVDDGFGAKNSVVIVGGAAGAVAAPAAAATVSPAKATGAAPSVSAGGVKFTYTGAGNAVALAGEFNAWNTTADPLTKQPDGSWTVVRKLDPGKYAYKFVVDGNNWKQDPAATESVDDGLGGKNSLIVVGAGGGAAASTTPAAASTSGTAVTAGTTAKGVAPKLAADGVTFTYAGAADQVALAGDFNSWSTTADPLVKQADGTWTIVRKLAAGSYSYKFLVNGKTWKQDEANPEAKDDGFGGKNSVVTVH